ncbi:Hydroxyindole-O-methyltransferase [Handroanthus impetiginosus]|uniref:Hydroxyindole-O-methyltransferase n=1 Tax=Handroanthus impetiginosus TaxID=429701 RepID=A0A2G9GYX8_9LAMI|nr:Hydroxyindole-O-methyltransferase [Handroanthus impetiginosus]
MDVKSLKEVDEEAQAQVDEGQYIFAFLPMAVVKCAIELQILDVFESHGGAMTLPELSAALGCSPSVLSCVMRYLIHRGIFKQKCTSQESPICYVQMALSPLLTKRQALTNGALAFESAHEEDIWDYGFENPAQSKLFNDGMACSARWAMSAIIDHYPQAFKGISSLVDVGGGNGTALHTVVKSCPWIHGINFDLSHVVSATTPCNGLEHLVLHDWSDDECFQILKKCQEAIPKDTGKVIIAEVVIRKGGEDEFTDARLAYDMAMLAHTEKEKERTFKEWEYVLNAAGFNRYVVKHIEGAIISVIEAYPRVL